MAGVPMGGPPPPPPRAPVSDEMAEAWFYNDPHGNRQGPFALITFRHWCSLPEPFADVLRTWPVFQHGLPEVPLETLLNRGQPPQQPQQPPLLPGNGSGMPAMGSARPAHVPPPMGGAADGGFGGFGAPGGGGGSPQASPQAALPLPPELRVALKEAVTEQVKRVLQPHYRSKKITSDQFKKVARSTVHKFVDDAPYFTDVDAFLDDRQRDKIEDLALQTMNSVLAG